jgi:tetratricopeptide (TPR) repeat protein
MNDQNNSTYKLNNEPINNSFSLYLPVWKFILFNALTGGLYLFYWFYKNWTFLKINEDTKINPLSNSLAVIWTFFNTFRGYNCLKRIYIILDKDRFKKWKLVLIMFFYFITEPSYNALYKEGISFFPCIWLIATINTLPFAFFQKDINKYFFEQSTKEDTAQRNFLYITTAITVILFGFSFNTNPYKNFFFSVSGDFNFDFGNYNQAIINYQKSLKYNNKDADIWLSLSQAQRNLGKYADSVKSLEKVIAIEPINLEGYLLLGASEAQLNKHGLAIKNFNKALSLDKENFRAYFGLGYSYWQLNKLDLAIINFKKAIKTDPEYSDIGDIYGFLGAIYLKQEKYDLAIEEFNKEINTKTDNVATYACLSNAYLLKNKTDLAIKYGKKAVELDPNSAEAYLSLGSAYAKKNKSNLAINNLKRAIELKPDCAPAYGLLGMLYDQQKYYDKAKEYHQKACKLDSSMCSVRN